VKELTTAEGNLPEPPPALALRATTSPVQGEVNCGDSVAARLGGGSVKSRAQTSDQAGGVPVLRSRRLTRLRLYRR